MMRLRREADVHGNDWGFWPYVGLSSACGSRFRQADLERFLSLVALALRLPRLTVPHGDRSPTLMCSGRPAGATFHSPATNSGTKRKRCDGFARLHSGSTHTPYFTARERRRINLHSYP